MLAKSNTLLAIFIVLTLQNTLLGMSPDFDTSSAPAAPAIAKSQPENCSSFKKEIDNQRNQIGQQQNKIDDLQRQLSKKLEQIKAFELKYKKLEKLSVLQIQNIKTACENKLKQVITAKGQNQQQEQKQEIRRIQDQRGSTRPFQENKPAVDKRQQETKKTNSNGKAQIQKKFKSDIQMKSLFAKQPPLMFGSSLDDE